MNNQTHWKKKSGGRIDKSYIDKRMKGYAGKGFGKPKWMMFCEHFLELGFTIRLYEARETFSKYVSVISQDGKTYKVRFSNHKPIKSREANGDCDFFVGINHFQTNTTEDAILSTKAFFTPSTL